MFAFQGGATVVISLDRLVGAPRPPLAHRPTTEPAIGPGTGSRRSPVPATTPGALSPGVDDDQLAALRRLRVAFGPVEVVEVVRHDLVVSDKPEDDRGEGTGELGEGATMADPRRMTPEEHGEAHALLVRAVTDPDWQAASQALDELMGKLVVLHRLLEAEERLPQRTPRRNG